MTTTANVGRGVHLQTSPDGTTYTSIAQLEKYAFAGLKANFDNITNIDTATVFEEWLPTTVDPGEVSFNGVQNAGDATQANLLTLLQNQTLEYFKIAGPGGHAATFQGYVSEYVPYDVDVKKAIRFSGKIKITGAVTLT